MTTFIVGLFLGFFLGIFLMNCLFTAKAPPPMVDESERWRELSKGMGHDEVKN